ncbi:MAG TPA: hypothetical protein VGS79_13860 [Puia sp.]|nr:hypothetical protein [Puia sp.]
MRLTFVFAAIGAILTVAVSCKKSSSPPSNAVTGTWNFVNMSARTQVNAVVSGDSTITYASYITQNNSGTITFTIDSMAVNGLAYSVSSTATTYAYYQGMIYDTLTNPFIATLPATSMDVSYKLIGTDSLYFPNGGLLPTGITSSSQGQGGHFVISGDTLRLTVSGADTTSGQIQLGTGVITLVRKM